MIIANEGEMQMSPVFEAVLAKYGWILIGITFGFAAKYALLIKRGVKVQARLVFADLLLLPMVALLAYWIASRAGFEGDAAALAAAFCTVGADRLIKLLTDRFLQRVDSEARMLAGEQIGRVRQVVQTELSGDRIIEDTIEGRAPVQYEALKPHPRATKPE
jgi:hypothetical protein